MTHEEYIHNIPKNKEQLQQHILDMSKSELHGNIQVRAIPVFQINNTKQILFLLRSDICKRYKDHYELPWGKVDIWETIFGALFRELQEELWITLKNIESYTYAWILHNNHKNHPWATVLYFETQIKKSDVHISDEHSEYKFIEQWDLLEILQKTNDTKNKTQKNKNIVHLSVPFTPYTVEILQQYLK